MMVAKVLAEGKGNAVRRCLRKPECKAVSRRAETSYKAESLGKAAQHVKVQDSGDTVNGAVVQGKFVSLSGEACLSCGM
jgi:hypothetical protein